ncbi:MAG: hypothetical protein WCJ54_01090 [Actinomycetota bacterium]
MALLKNISYCRINVKNMRKDTLRRILVISKIRLKTEMTINYMEKYYE